MEEMIFFVQKRMGYSERHAGTRMIRTAATYVARVGEEVSMTKEVYPHVAKVHNTTAAAAEHAMRYATKKAGFHVCVGEAVRSMAHIAKKVR